MLSEKNSQEATQETVSIEEYNALKKELMDFAYIISHDLNAPLRHAREFSKLLINKLGDKVSEDEREYVAFMQEGIKQAEAMVAGLLEYSRINTEGKEFSAVNTNQMIEKVKYSLKEEIEASKANIYFNPLPSVAVDTSQIESLFYHVISNAIKFSKEGIAPEVQIFASQQDGKVVFSIRDNGIGIPPAQHDNVFRIFKRLSNNDSVAGIGIGLSLVKKIILRHGGIIKIESELDEGTTLHLSLPGVL